MSDQYYENEYLNQFEEAPQAPRESNAMKALREKAEADSQKIAELSSIVEKLTNQNKRAAVQGVFESKGVNPKIAKFYKGEADTEQIDSWLAENADIFGLRQDEGNPSREEAGPNSAAPLSTVNQDQVEQFLRMQNAGIDGMPQGNHNEVLGSINGASSEEDLFNAMRRHGWNF